MVSFMYTIRVPVGLHARHAGLLVREVQRYSSAVTLCFGEKQADARRLKALMRLGIHQGDLVEIRVEGEDEQAAALALKSFFWTNF